MAFLRFTTVGLVPHVCSIVFLIIFLVRLDQFSLIPFLTLKCISISRLYLKHGGLAAVTSAMPRHYQFAMSVSKAMPG